MEFIDIKKETDEAIVDPDIRNEARRYSVPTRLAFLPDKVLGELWFSDIDLLLYIYLFSWI
jgi:hypothetical protein